MGKTVRDAMTDSVRTVTPSQPVTEAASMMKQEDVGALPVVEDDGRLAGMITDRDIVVRAVAEGKDPSTVTVGDIATKDVVSVDPDYDLDDALQLMAQHQVRRLPVVDGGRLVGVLAQADIAGEAGPHEVAHVLEEISQPAAD